jgi:hypothetical protein
MSAIEEVTLPATPYARNRADQQGITVEEMSTRILYVGEALLILEETKYAAFMNEAPNEPEETQ